MKQKTPTLIIMLLFILIQINSIPTLAQSSGNTVPTKTTGSTVLANNTDDCASQLDEASRLLDKSIAEKAGCVALNASLTRENDALRKLTAAQAKTVADQDALQKLTTKKPSKCFGLSIGSVCVGFKY